MHKYYVWSQVLSAAEVCDVSVSCLVWEVFDEMFHVWCEKCDVGCNKFVMYLMLDVRNLSAWCLVWEVGDMFDFRSFKCLMYGIRSLWCI